VRGRGGKTQQQKKRKLDCCVNSRIMRTNCVNFIKAFPFLSPSQPEFQKNEGEIRRQRSFVNLLIRQKRLKET